MIPIFVIALFYVNPSKKKRNADLRSLRINFAGSLEVGQDARTTGVVLGFHSVICKGHSVKKVETLLALITRRFQPFNPTYDTFLQLIPDRLYLYCIGEKEVGMRVSEENFRNDWSIRLGLFLWL